MSEADRQRWDARYAAGSHSSQDSPCGVLRDNLSQAPVGKALDVACGAGRNALYMARHGYVVDAVDVSPVALEIGARAVAQSKQALNIRWHCVDLLDASAHLQSVLSDTSLPASVSEEGYQLILLCHFIAPQLLAQLPGLLAPGGVLMVEEHLRWPTDVTGPRSARFRVEPGELVQQLHGSAPELEVLHEFEGLVPNDKVAGARDQSHSALARLVLRRPAGCG